MKSNMIDGVQPAHVHDSMVFDFDLYDFAVASGEYQTELKRTLRAPGMPETFWSRCNGGHWVVTRAALIEAGLKDYQHFSSREVTLPKQPASAAITKPLQVDPPEHMPYRQILAQGLAPRIVARLGEDARELATTLIEGFKDNGQCDFISEFAEHLPVVTFMRLLDLPEGDREFLARTAEIAVHGSEAEKVTGRNQMAEYGLSIVRQRRAVPKDDLISAIGQARIDNQLLDDDTIAGMVQLLLLAGLDTVTSMLGFFAVFLARNSDHRRQLTQSPAKIPNAVEELLRRYGIAMVSREVVQDFEFGGVWMRRGDMLLLPTPLDGLDESKYPDPEAVDFSRKVNNHTTFGFGAHRCLGAMLARVELRVFLDEWLRLIPDFCIQPNSDIAVSSGATVAITRLPLVWDAKA